MATAMPLLTYELTPFLYAIVQITLFDASVNDCTWWTFTNILPPYPPPTLATILNTRSLSDVKLCTEIYGDEGPSTSEDPNSMQLAARKDARWSPGDKLSVYFIGGSPLVHKKVRPQSIIDRHNLLLPYAH